MSKTYYSIADDVKNYPDAWCYVIVGGRNTGKTYGALLDQLERKEPHVFIKRTNKDVELLCTGNHIGEKGKGYELDFSPYKSINRDKGENIKAFKINDGIGAFYRTDGEDGATGRPLGYLLSLSSVHKYKGFDLSECGVIIFDEFIPQPWERVGRKEGEQLMDLYKTVARDRTLRGLPELRLYCLANAVNIYNPTCEVLEVTDTVADMAAHGLETFYDEQRGIFIRKLVTSDTMMAAEQKTGIYRAMAGTAWGDMAFNNEFAYNDFSCVQKVSLKNYRPFIELTYKRKKIYIYSNGQGFYMCSSRNKCPTTYNLNREMDQRAFWLDHGIDLLNASTRGQMLFEKYSFYDLIVNFRSRFTIK